MNAIGKNTAKNIVLCFDRAPEPGQRDETNAEALVHLLDDSDEQVIWYHPGDASPPLDPRRPREALRWREALHEATRATVVEAYEFVADTWRAGDRIYMFGIGRGAYCARAVARLLGTIGILPDGTEFDDYAGYTLATYALPRADRSADDWRSITDITAGFVGSDVAVPVEYLGLWDAVKIPGLPRISTTEPLANVKAGRHAVAIDGGPFSEQLGQHAPDAIEEAWFRGTHSDVTGGPGACWPLSDIALDWVLAGAVSAGVTLGAHGRAVAPTPCSVDALAGVSQRTMWLRKLPVDAHLHASVEMYLHAHPAYWRRLPARVKWADIDWLDRGERLIPVAAILEESANVESAEQHEDVSPAIESDELATAAS